MPGILRSTVALLREPRAPGVLVAFTLVEAALRLVPFRVLRAVLDVHLDGEAFPASRCREVSDAERERLGLIARVGRVWPFGSGACLREALVAGWFLRRHEPTLHIGVRRTAHGLEAHAWLSAGDELLGTAPGFTTLRSRPA